MADSDTAKTLRDAAEMTAKASQNWNNFEAICLDALRSTRTDAYNEGYKTGRKQVFDEHISLPASDTGT